VLEAARVRGCCCSATSALACCLYQRRGWQIMCNSLIEISVRIYHLLDWCMIGRWIWSLLSLNFCTLSG
jgi:hypothetical protein